MKFEFSLLSKHRSFIGFEISKGGYLSINEEGATIVKRTINISFGFLFGWIEISIDFGGSFNLDKVTNELKELVNRK